MSTEVIDAPIARRGLRPQWATTTTSTFENDAPHVSIASEPEPGPNTIFLEVPYTRMKFDALPPSVGRLILVEGAIEQVGQLEDVVGSTSWLPRFSVAYRWPCTTETRISPSGTFGDEALDWDVSIEVAPQRASGTFAVTLNYGGRGKPAAFEDPWE